jgi:hypothetical protein
MAGLKLRKYQVVICVIARTWAFQLRAVDALAERRDRAAGVHALLASIFCVSLISSIPARKLARSKRFGSAMREKCLFLASQGTNMSKAFGVTD